MDSRKKGLVVKVILSTIAVGGLITLVAVCPNAVQALTLLTGRSRRPYYVRAVVGRLLDRGLIEFKKTRSGKKYLHLTDKGRKELLKYQVGELTIKKPKHWDGKWRVIIFDIKELRRGDRDRLRVQLRRLGFARLQQSVWIYPYHCEELIVLLKSYFRFGKDLLYMTVDHLEYDQGLREQFGLR